MDRVPVASRAITSAGWEKDTLEIEFPNGDVYQYSPVNKSTMEAMFAAQSVGSYFMRNIRNSVRGLKV
jgi:hypothetical protein